MVRSITREALKQQLESGAGPVLVEALPAKYYRHAHLPGAVNIPHDEVDSLAPQLLPMKDAAIVVYCANAACKNSAIAAERLVALGYTNVSTYEGGKKDWIDAGLPVEGDSRAAA